MKPKILKTVFTVFSVLLISNSVSYSQWYQLTTNTTETLQDIYFINTNTGIAVGTGGKILRTSNAGQNWSTVSSGTSNTLYSLDFPDILTGYTGGYTGTVLRTLNGGASWTPRTGCGINIRSISFLNVNTGITAGGGNLMCYTTDGGQNWDPRYVPQYVATSVTFINSNTLLVSATDLPGAVIYKSTSSGYNWTAVLTLNNSGVDILYSLLCIYFKDPLTGFCAGSCTMYGQMWGYIYRTTNGGNNWALSGSIGPSAGSGLYGVDFGDTVVGFAVGNNGVIMRSTNGGANWAAQSCGSTNSLASVYMLNAMTGYVCGSSGLILKTTNGGTTGFINLNGGIPDKFSLYQNYPNPFNPVTKIKFDLPAAGRYSPVETIYGSPVRLIIYDILGREVAMLVNEQLKPGTYEVEWNASNYPSGVYFYKLVSGDFNETRMMILVK